jgi:antitoxin VapB
MSKEFPARSFKSGNSVAIRMPAALGIEPDKDWTVVREDDRIVIEAKDKPKRKFNIAKVAGSARSLRYIEPESRLFDTRPSAADPN